MKFNEIKEKNEIKEWIYIKKNPFTKRIISSIVLTNIENDEYLKKELNFLGNEMLNNSVFFERGNGNLKKLNKFKNKKYIVTYVNSDELERYIKFGFTTIIVNKNIPGYDYCVYKTNPISKDINII